MKPSESASFLSTSLISNLLPQEGQWRKKVLTDDNFRVSGDLALLKGLRPTSDSFHKLKNAKSSHSLRYE